MDSSPNEDLANEKSFFFANARPAIKSGKEEVKPADASPNDQKIATMYVIHNIMHLLILHY